MKRNKWLAAAVVLTGMAAVFVPAASAASVPTNGTGTVIENTTADSSSREFFTIKTADGNVFYIVVDKTKTDDNVYLLTPVTEDSLKALAESATQKTATGTTGILGSLSGSSSSSSAAGTSTATGTGSGTTSTGSAAKMQKTTTAASVGNIAFIALVAILVFGAAFYFKIYRPRHAQGAEEYDGEQDEQDGDAGESGGNEEDEGEPEEQRPAQEKKPDTGKTAFEPARKSFGGRPEPDRAAAGTVEPAAQTAPRSRREDMRSKNYSEEPENSGQGQSELPRPIRQASNSGLFTAPADNEPDEEPDDDENARDYEDGMDMFDDPDREET